MDRPRDASREWDPQQGAAESADRAPAGAVDELRGITDQLHDQLDMLRDQLGPVLRPDDERSPTADRTPAIAEVEPIATDLEGANMRLRLAVGRIESFRARLVV